MATLLPRVPSAKEESAITPGARSAVTNPTRLPPIPSAVGPVAQCNDVLPRRHDTNGFEANEGSEKTGTDQQAVLDASSLGGVCVCVSCVCVCVLPG